MKNLDIIEKGIRYAYSFVFNKPCIGPYLLVLRVCNCCNMKCIFCPINSSSSRIRIKEKKEMDIALFRDIVDEAAKLGVSTVELNGNGEPLMHKQVFEMLGYIKEKGMAASIVTNGLLLNRRSISNILKLGVDKLTVSIDSGSSDVYNMVHNPPSKSSFKLLRNNILNLDALRKASGSSMQFIFNYTLFNRNYYDIFNGVKLAKDAGADLLAFRNFNPYPGLEHLSIRKEEVNHYNKLLSDAKHLAAELGVNTNLDFFLSSPSSGKETPCYIGWFYMMVRSDGNILTCCTGPKRYSSLENRKLSEIWGSASYAKFRTLWNNKSARIKEGYGCETCIFKTAQAKLDKAFKPLKPLKYAVETLSGQEC